MVAQARAVPSNSAALDQSEESADVIGGGFYSTNYWVQGFSQRDDSTLSWEGNVWAGTAAITQMLVVYSSTRHTSTTPKLPPPLPPPMSPSSSTTTGSPAPTTAALETSVSEDNRRTLQYIADLLSENTREAALLELSKKREQDEEPTSPCGFFPVEILGSPVIRQALQSQGVIIVSDNHVDNAAAFSTTVRKEMKELVKAPAFGIFEAYKHVPERPTSIAQVCDTAWLEKTLDSAWKTLKKDAPNMVTFFLSGPPEPAKFTSFPEIKKKALASIDFNDEKSSEIYLLASLLTDGYARNNRSFLRHVLGLYMLCKWHTKTSYRDPRSYRNMVVVYDNFNFMNRTREPVGGKQDEMINLTTTCIVACPGLAGALQSSNFRPRTPFTKKMIINYILPRRKTVDNAPRWLLKQAFMKIFTKKDMPEMPVVKRVKFETSPYLQVGAIFEDEGTIDGLVSTKLEDIDERITLIYGDCKTTSFIRRIKQSQYEASEKLEQKKWLIPAPASFFHIELNYIEMLLRVFLGCRRR
ncbi:hypothetical protein B0T24DRAFT_712087 [Lasiosphaeria ovina]|uniref:DUF6589 domain-containing protein n=1 Tax=Lasiosphaeria ovina TaxID=92902 RepID=A0AAE0MZ13_9PEZI|nr:hypothetical protein B0T24DRAFT_712087 [Lasiosphaeria ovina]